MVGERRLRRIARSFWNENRPLLRKHGAFIMRGQLRRARIMVLGFNPHERHPRARAGFRDLYNSTDRSWIVMDETGGRFGMGLRALLRDLPAGEQARIPVTNVCFFGSRDGRSLADRRAKIRASVKPLRRIVRAVRPDVILCFGTATGEALRKFDMFRVTGKIGGIAGMPEVEYWEARLTARSKHTKVVVLPHPSRRLGWFRRPGSRKLVGTLFERAVARSRRTR